jgi:hypothetical protein
MHASIRCRLLVALIVTLASVGHTTAQGSATDRVMRKKLEISQKILEAVVTSRWADLEARSRDLEDLTNDPGWAVLKNPESAKHSRQFRDTVRALHAAAAARDLDATPKAYVEVTLSCVECHRYLARNRIARQLYFPR